mmetsp:Transcript_4576/g.10756  ORF Transcript_4576/g.10756 Transcript_4576/m.10756 type:complete len:278 (-) Transcript_4576:502-1335(-)
MAAKYREALPCLSEELYLTDAGIETVLIFEDKVELPSFAAFTLLKTEEGTAALQKYYKPFIELANEKGVGCILESATWRASPDWGTKLGCSAEELASLNQKSVTMLLDMRERMERNKPVILSGCVGPRGDGYVVGEAMTVEEAMAYHNPQVAALAGAGADVISGITMTNSAEAAGLAQACSALAMPCVISFTVETDGTLPSGETLKSAIGVVDGASGHAPPQYYMLNCAHPTHIAAVLEQAAASAEPLVRFLELLLVLASQTCACVWTCAMRRAGGC